MNVEKDMNSDKISLEAAIAKAGFGLYGCLMTALTALILISFASIAYGGTFIVPTSACELQTTTAQQGLLATAPIISLLLGGVVWSYLADTRGRRAMLLISLTGAATFNIISTISVNWIMLMIFQLLAGIFAAGIYSVSMTLISECVPMTHRNSVVLVVASVMFLSQGIKGVVALIIIPLGFSYYLPSLGIYWNSWRTLMLIYCIPALISASCLFFMQESPKFVFNKRGETEALEVLKKIHRFNNWRSEEELGIKGLIQDEMIVPKTQSSVRDQLLPLFKAPLLKFTIIMLFMNVTQQLTAFVIWMPTIADQFVRIIQAGDSTNLTVCDIMGMEPVPADPNATPCALDETSLLIVLGVGAMQCIFNLIVSFLINYVGRRNISIAVITLCGVSGILVNLVPNVIGSGLLFCVMILGVVVVGLITAICIALFPTNLRAMAISFTMISQYLGIVASVQLLNWLLTVNCAAGFYIFGSLFTSAAVAAFFLPDDRKQQATESSQESLSEDTNTEKKIY